MVRELPNFLGEDWIRTGRLMETLLGSDIDLLDRTNRTLLANSGKKLRPMLCLLSAKAVGGQPVPATISYAASAELLHNATLLHDDVVDGSDLRRGKPTVWSLLGGTASVLIGDYWLVKALEAIIDAGGPTEPVLKLFSWTLTQLAEGEVLQLQMAASGKTTETEYLRIIRGKTASLFETAAVSGALSVGAAEERVEAVRTYAMNLGLAFQIRDDIFDYAADGGIGKPVGQDLLEQKITQPLLCALETADPAKAAEIRARVTAIGEHPEYREQICRFVAEADGVDAAFAKLALYTDRAKAALGALPESEAREWLVKLADYMGTRTK